MAVDLLPAHPQLGGADGPGPSMAGRIPVSHLNISQKSFAAAIASSAALASSAPPSNPRSTAAPSFGFHKGQPSITFDDNLLQDLSAPYGWSLIGKFAQGFNRANPKLGRPSTEDIHKHLHNMDFKGCFTTGLMDNRHVWIRFSTEDDYLRLYSRPIWYIGGKEMRMFKWTPYFRVDIKSSLVPVWVKFPRLPIQFFQRSALFPIASLIGLPLRMDAATEALRRPSVARMQIEIDLLKPRHDKVWITVGSGGGYWQAVEYEAVPDYCSQCLHVGHKQQNCALNNLEQPSCEGRSMTDKCQWIVKPPVPSSTVLPLSEDTTKIQPAVLLTSTTAAKVMEPEVGSVPEEGSHNAGLLILDTIPKKCSHDAGWLFPEARQIQSPNDPPLLPVIFCGDTSESDADEGVEVTPIKQQNKLCGATDPISSPSSVGLNLSSAHASPGSPVQQISRPVVSCGDEGSSRSPEHHESTPVDPNSSSSLLNINVSAWFPQSRVDFHSPMQSGRILPHSLEPPTYDLGADDSEIEEDAEDDDGESVMQNFLDSQRVRDDSYLEERNNREARRERDMVLIRRGRGRPLGSLNRTFSDAEQPMRQSGRRNKGIPPKYFEPSL